MRRLLITLAACALGFLAAFAFSFTATVVRPCTGESLSCTMTSIVALIYIPVFGVIALLVFSIAVFSQSAKHALNIAALVPLVPFTLRAAYIKVSEISARELNEIRERDIQELLQIAIPIVMTIVIPWIVLQYFSARAATKVQAHG